MEYNISEELIENSTFVDVDGNVLPNPYSGANTSESTTVNQQPENNTTEDISIHDTPQPKNKKFASIEKADEIFKNVYNKFIEHYDEDRVDINYKTNKIIVHYPKITVKNSLDMVHDITDLYVEYTFKKTVENDYIEIYIDNLEGIRMSFTTEEFFAGYSFSHLSGDITGYGRFCMGHLTPVSIGYKRIHLFPFIKDKYEEENLYKNLETFFYLFDAYLEWESIYTSPYKLLSSLGTNRFKSVKNKFSFYREDTLIAEYLTKLIFLNDKLRNKLFDFCIFNSGDGIKINIFQLTMLLDDLFVDELKDTKSRLFIRYDPVTYKPIYDDPLDIETYVSIYDGTINNGQTITFKDKEIKQTINDIKDRINMIKDDILIISPSIVSATALRILVLFKNLKYFKNE